MATPAPYCAIQQALQTRVNGDLERANTIADTARIYVMDTRARIAASDCSQPCSVIGQTRRKSRSRPGARRRDHHRLYAAKPAGRDRVIATDAAAPKTRASTSASPASGSPMNA